jgi:MFS family permease
MQADKSEFSRGWKVLLAGFLGTMCGASPLPMNVLGFLFDPLNRAYGWNRTEVSLGLTIFGVTAALLAPAFGAWADRIGVRKVGIWSMSAFIVAFAALSLTPNSLAVYYLLWLLVGLVGIGSTPVSWSRAISTWFVRNRGLALGMMLIGTSAAAFAVPRIAVAAQLQFGWRAIFPAVALLPLLLAMPAILAWFREPQATERANGIAGKDGELLGMSFSEAVRTRPFWLLWFSIMIIALAYGGAHAHMPAIVKDHGVGLDGAAGIMGVVGAGLLIGRLGVGWLLDHIWGPAVAFPVLCLPAVACYLLLGTSSEIGTITLAAFLLGFAAGAESDLIAFFAARYFGMVEFGRIYGLLYMPFGLMSAASPVIYGLVRDHSGSYDPILQVASVLFVLGGALLLLLGRYPDRFKEGDNV